MMNESRVIGLIKALGENGTGTGGGGGGGGLPENADPLKQLVTDHEGKVVWEDRLAYKYTTVNMVDIQVQYEGPESEENLIITTWPADPVGGAVWDIAFNGVTYACQLFDASGAMGLPAGSMCYAGNIGAMDENLAEFGNPDCPFVLMIASNAIASQMGAYGVLMVLDAFENVTLAVGTPVVSKKTIDNDLLPDDVKRHHIELVDDGEGNITTTTDFETAWEMSDEMLASSIFIRDDAAAYTASAAAICKETASNKREIQVTYYPKHKLMSYNEVYTILWRNNRGTVSFVRRKYYTLFGGGSTTGYARWNGSGWDCVTIDQLKKDLGLA